MTPVVAQRTSGYWWWTCPCGKYASLAWPTKDQAEASADDHVTDSHEGVFA